MVPRRPRRCWKVAWMGFPLSGGQKRRKQQGAGLSAPRTAPCQADHWGEAGRTEAPGVVVLAQKGSGSSWVGLPDSVA